MRQYLKKNKIPVSDFFTRPRDGLDLSIGINKYWPEGWPILRSQDK
jgi:hypothetical protein